MVAEQVSTMPQEPRLVLGTAQLGTSYGIANQSTSQNQETATALIQEAWNNGVREFDTAQAYKNSESFLGGAFAELGIAEQVRVVSKLDPSLDYLDQNILSQALSESLERLGVSKLHGLLLHREELFSLWNEGLHDSLQGLIKQGMTDQIGISVYSPEKALWGIETEGIDFIQVPTNFLDHRFLQAGIFESAVQNKKTIYIRSVFLQGLVLMEPDNVPPHLAYARSTIEKIQKLTEATSCSAHTMALGFVKHQTPQAQIIFGAETPSQIQDNLTSWNSILSSQVLKRLQSDFYETDERIINPVLWPKPN